MENYGRSWIHLDLGQHVNPGLSHLLLRLDHSNHLSMSLCDPLWWKGSSVGRGFGPNWERSWIVGRLLFFSAAGVCLTVRWFWRFMVGQWVSCVRRAIQSVEIINAFGNVVRQCVPEGVLGAVQKLCHRCITVQMNCGVHPPLTRTSACTAIPATRPAASGFGWSATCATPICPQSILCHIPPRAALAPWVFF